MSRQAHNQTCTTEVQALCAACATSERSREREELASDLCMTAFLPRGAAAHLRHCSKGLAHPGNLLDIYLREGGARQSLARCRRCAQSGMPIYGACYEMFIVLSPTMFCSLFLPIYLP